MTAESDAFEQLNSRIAHLVHGHGATVQWNGSVPDPDSPADLRQIDVLIRCDDGRVLSVECRHRAGAQSVMWIEELAGRKLSIGLDGMIAVSVAGFSTLALKKARRFGIVLYDFESLTDQEIASWSGLAGVEARFVQFDSLDILAGVPAPAEPLLSAAPLFRFGDKDGYAALMDRIRDDALGHPAVQRFQRHDPAGFTVDGVGLTLLESHYIGRPVIINAQCTAVSAIGTPGVAAPLRDVTVQKFDHSVPEIIQHGNEAHLLIDVSKITPPSDAILHELRVTFPQVTTVKQYELVGARSLLAPASKIQLRVATAT